MTHSIGALGCILAPEPCVEQVIQQTMSPALFVLYRGISLSVVQAVPCWPLSTSLKTFRLPRSSNEVGIADDVIELFIYCFSDPTAPPSMVFELGYRRQYLPCGTFVDFPSLKTVRIAAHRDFCQTLKVEIPP
jgi:hypothetical protein